MSWTTVYHPNLRIVETRYEGVLSLEELSEAVDAVLQLLREHDAHLFLADCANMRGGHSLSDLYSKAESVVQKGVPPGLREAIIEPEFEDPARGMAAWQALASTRGIVVELFRDRAAAIAWLVNGE